MLSVTITNINYSLLFRKTTAAAVYCLNSSAKIRLIITTHSVGYYGDIFRKCKIEAPGLDARGVVVDGSSNVLIENCTIENCFNSGVWAKGGSLCHVEGGKIDGCGGYGAIYCTNGATMRVDRVKQGGNPRGCGVFVLHDRSRVHLDSCQFDGNKWSGFGCR